MSRRVPDKEVVPSSWEGNETHGNDESRKGYIAYAVCIHLNIFFPQPLPSPFRSCFSQDMSEDNIMRLSSSMTRKIPSPRTAAIVLAVLLPIAAFGFTVGLSAALVRSFSYGGVCKLLAVLLLPLIFISDLRRRLSNDIPGPALAKITVLWKMWHCRTGRYAELVHKLHQKHGSLVQVGPYEYSVSNEDCFGQFASLKKAAPQICNQSAHERLVAALTMENVFRYEPAIEKCNNALIEALTRSATSEHEIDLSDLIARYAFDMLFSTTVGNAPGFLDGSKDVSKLTDAMRTWKLHAILHGSYMRFYPRVSKILRWMGFGGNYERLVSKHLKVATDASEDRCAFDERRDLDGDAVEACLALVMAGSDPVITHILTSLIYIYRDSELVQNLRDEIAGARLGDGAKFKDLIHAMPRMPLLHATLHASLRRNQPSNGFAFVTDEPVAIDEKCIPKDVSITLVLHLSHLPFPSSRCYGYFRAVELD